MTKQRLFGFAEGDPLVDKNEREEITREVIEALETRLSRVAKSIFERVLTDELQKTVAAVFDKKAEELLDGQKQLIREIIEALNHHAEAINALRRDQDGADWWKQGDGDDGD